MAPPKGDRKKASGSEQGGPPTKSRKTEKTEKPLDQMTEAERNRVSLERDVDRIRQVLEDPARPETSAMQLFQEYMSVYGFGPKHPSSLLLWAAKGGHASVLRLILIQGVSIKVRSLFTALCFTAERNNIPGMKILLEYKAPWTFSGLDKLEPLPEEKLDKPRAKAEDREDCVLIWAVRGMAHEATRFILEAGISANSCGYEYGSPLYCAVNRNDRTMACLLLDFGANLEVGSYGADTPLSQAIQLGHAEMAALLIVKGAAVDHADESGYTIAHHAAWPGSSPEILKILVEGGANLSAVDNLGRTPLHIAASSGCVRMVQYLHKAGAQPVWDQTKFKWPLITEMALQGNAVMYGLLFKLFGVVQTEHNFPLHYAVISNHVGVVRMAIAKGEDVRVVYGGTARKTYLHAAASKNSYECVPPLVTAGCDVNAVDGQGLTPLHIAVKNSHFEAAFVLCKLGANMQVRDTRGSTPLHYAVRSGKVDIFNLLVKSVVRTINESQAFLSHKDDISGTVVHAAVHAGHMYMLKELLRFGADALAPDNSGRNAIQLARDLRRKEQESVLTVWVTKRPPPWPYPSFPDLNTIDLPDELEGLIYDEAAVTNIDLIQEVVYVPINETMDPHPDLTIVDVRSLAYEEPPEEIKQEMPPSPPFVPDPPTPASATSSPREAGNIEGSAWTSNGANTTATTEKAEEDFTSL